MKAISVFLCLLLAGPLCAEPIRLHPDNPHYFLFHGKPEVIITSGEHYGAVLNADFDFITYLDTLQRDGMNGTRTFSGAYCEAPGAFKIEKNTLAPAPAKLLCPWARSNEPGYANGGNKFDLTKWDESYFQRLTNFVNHAAKSGVIVEFTLFCPFYDDSMWALSPQNVKNNINGIGNVPRDLVYTLDKNGGLLAVQEAMTRKIVTELNRFDNVMFEICNEPYFGGVTEEWQRRIADVIVETESGLPQRHLITKNIANKQAEVKDPHPAVSVFNFHYAFPPKTVGLNYGLNKVIGDNETGFKGAEDAHYRNEAWAFILAGGALYNNLDYSFTVGHEVGDFAFPATQPGGGSAALRRNLRQLRDFIRSFDFVRMKPAAAGVVTVTSSGKGVVSSLVEEGKQYAIWLSSAGKGLPVDIKVPAGKYSGYWLDTVSANKVEIAPLEPQDGQITLTCPGFPGSAAVRLVKD